jgi:hypothetical protein
MSATNISIIEIDKNSHNQYINEIQTLMTDCGWGTWIANINLYNAFRALLKDNNEIIGHITYGNAAPHTANGYYGYNIDNWLETSAVCISSKYRGQKLLGKFFYHYLNSLDTKNIEGTWLFISQAPQQTFEKLRSMYSSYGFEPIYCKPVSGGTGNDYEPSCGRYLMKYKLNQQITPHPFQNTFITLPSVNQNNHGDLGLCGMYVMINALLITSIAKYYPDKLGLLVDTHLLDHMKKKFSDLIFHNIKEYENVDLKKALNYAPYYKFSDGQFGQLIMQFYNIYAFEQNNISEVHGIMPLIKHKIISYDYQNTDYAFNTDLFQNHVIIIEGGFNNSEFCNGIWLNPVNLKIMRNFYALDSYIVTFVIGNHGHWKCYTVNKVKKQSQYFYIDSLYGFYNAQPNPTMVDKIRAIINMGSVDRLIQQIIDCVKHTGIIHSFDPGFLQPLCSSKLCDFLGTNKCKELVAEIKNRFSVDVNFGKFCPNLQLPHVPVSTLSPEQIAKAQQIKDFWEDAVNKSINTAMPHVPNSERIEVLKYLSHIH